MAMFNSFLYVYQRVCQTILQINPIFETHQPVTPVTPMDPNGCPHLDAAHRTRATPEKRYGYQDLDG